MEERNKNDLETAEIGGAGRVEESVKYSVRV